MCDYSPNSLQQNVFTDKVVGRDFICKVIINNTKKFQGLIKNVLSFKLFVKKCQSYLCVYMFPSIRLYVVTCYKY